MPAWGGRNFGIKKELGSNLGYFTYDRAEPWEGGDISPFSVHGRSNFIDFNLWMNFNSSGLSLFICKMGVKLFYWAGLKLNEGHSNAPTQSPSCKQGLLSVY